VVLTSLDAGHCIALKCVHSSERLIDTLLVRTFDVGQSLQFPDCFSERDPGSSRENATASSKLIGQFLLIETLVVCVECVSLSLSRLGSSSCETGRIRGK